MWYRNSKKQIEDEQDFEARILRAAAVRAVRRHLRLKGNYHPGAKDIQNYVQRILGKLRDRFKKLSHVRTFAGDDRVAQVVNEVAEEIFHLK